MFRTKKIIADFGNLLGFYSRKSLLRIWPPDSFLILTYHRVGNNRCFPALPTEIFFRQVLHLRHNFAVMGLSEIIAFRAEKRILPPLALAITFDDGYADTYTNAFPILQKHGIKAAVFPATASIDGGVLWTDRAAIISEKMCAAAARKSDAWKQILVFCKNSFPEYNLEESVGGFKELLKRLPVRKTQEILDGVEKIIVASEGSALNYPRGEMMTWSQLRELEQTGWDIGAHTHNHAILSLLDEPSVKSEIILSRDLIHKETGVAPHIFCYPNGGENDFNETVIRLLKDAGFKCALTTIEGLNTAATDAFSLRRSWTTEASISLFARRLWKTAQTGRR